MDHILNNSEKPIPTADDLKADEDDEDEGAEAGAVKALEGQEAKVRSTQVSDKLEDIT